MPGLEVAAHYHPASPDEVGGDFYDLFPLDDGRWGLFLGDVCGKGAGAAVVTSLARYTLRAAAVDDPDPVAVLTKLNTALHREATEPAHRFCTVVFGVLTPTADGCDVVLAGGGHPPPALLRADGTAALRLRRRRAARRPPARGHLRAHDPAPRARRHAPALHGRADRGPRRSGQPLRRDALLEFLAGRAPASAPDVVTAIRGLLDGFGEVLDDDTAVLAVGVPGGPSPAPPSRAS